MRACCSRCCKLVDTRALPTDRSRVLIRRRFSLPAYKRVTIFLLHLISAAGMGLAYKRVLTY